MSEATYCDVTLIGAGQLSQIVGAKTLQLLSYGGLTYAVDRSIKEGDVVAVFLPDSRLSEEFATVNDLIQRTDPDTGQRAGGFFGSNRKVRTLSLMNGKIKSAGFVATQPLFDYTGIKLEDYVGKSFNELGGHKICEKFINANVKAEVNARDRRRERRKYIPKTMGLIEHPETQQFSRFAGTLEIGDVITITLKLDGTSVRIANTYQIKENLKWYEKLIDKFMPIQRIFNSHRTGTRRVVLTEKTGAGYYGSNSLYQEVGKILEGKLHPGESIFGEIVGWQSQEKPLFIRGGMKFLYGCAPGTRDFYVYNIRWTLPDGESIDLPWNKIKQRCVELGVKHVPEMSVAYEYGIFNDGNHPEMYDFWNWTNPLVYDGNLKALEAFVYGMIEGLDLIDPSHIREGVVLRVEKINGETKFYKAKSQTYYALEDKSKNAGETDIEEMNDQMIDEVDNG